MPIRTRLLVRHGLERPARSNYLVGRLQQPGGVKIVLVRDQTDLLVVAGVVSSVRDNYLCSDAMRLGQDKDETKDKKNSRGDSTHTER